METISLVNVEEVISLSHAKVFEFSDSVLYLGKVNENPTSNTVWEEQLGWFTYSPQYRIRVDFSPGFEAYGFLNPVIIQCHKEILSLTCVEKLHANETREQCYDLRQKQVIRATGLSKQCTDTCRAPDTN